MKAQYDGPCAGDCGGRIHPGDDIEPVPGIGHQHTECAAVDRGQLTAFDAPGRTERKCTCNLIHAGECF